MANNMIKKPRGLTADLGISNVNRKPTGPKDIMAVSYTHLTLPTKA